MQTAQEFKRLLVLDVDNTLLHVPTFDPMINILAGGKITQQEFYEGLPDWGIPVKEGGLLKVFPRPHLLEFLDGAEALGYDLAICTTATEHYISVILPLCGVSLDRFVAAICREKLTPHGRKTKNIGPFVELGYPPESIVAIDDMRDIYMQPMNVIQIPPFYADHKNCEKDEELLLMLERLRRLDGQSLTEVREHYIQHSWRENHIRELAIAAFNCRKYKHLPYQPKIFEKVCADIESYPAVTPPIKTSLDRFLIFKDHGLVGGLEKQGESLRITNYCPEVWTDFPSGNVSMNLTHDKLDRILRPSNRERLQNLCHFMGYDVSEDDALTLAAISLQPIDYKGLHILALNQNMLDDDIF